MLFLKSLEKNRSAFVEYFLSAGFDPLTLAERDDIYSYQVIILKLYNNSYEAMTTVCFSFPSLFRFFPMRIFYFHIES